MSRIKKKNITDVFKTMERRLFFYIMTTSYDIKLDFWTNINLFKWFRYFFSIMDANKDCFGDFFVSI